MKQDSFQDTETFVLDYNIIQNYAIENGKLNRSGEKGLTTFKYQGQQENINDSGESNDNINSNDLNNISSDIQSQLRFCWKQKFH